jgi:hypothetical protein
MPAPQVSGSAGIAGTRDNVRYLGQFGEHILSESFTAPDPKLSSTGACRRGRDRSSAWDFSPPHLPVRPGHRDIQLQTP